MCRKKQEREIGEETVLRERMVQEQLVARGIDNPRILQAFRTVPRSFFCSDYSSMGEIYADHAMPIKQGQTISQPYMVALMTSLLDPGEDEKVLEIGTGSGYQAAILASLAREVHTVERIPELAESAERVLQRLRFDNVHVHVGDGTLGWPEQAPYDLIMVTAAAPEVPQPLQEQIADGGRLLAPIGDRTVQRLVLLSREGDGIVRRQHESCVFVPLLGEHGWSD